MAKHLFSHQPISQTYYSQRLRLHYVEWVNNDAPPMIMVHGGSDHCRNWDWTARALNEQYNIVAPDLRGHGDSEWINGAYKKADFVYDLQQLITTKGYKKVTIIAHSFGAWVSMLFAGLKPEMVEKLVIIEGLQPMNVESRKKLKYSRHKRLNIWLDHISNLSSILKQKRFETFEDAVQRLHAANLHLTQEQARHLTEHAARKNEDGTYSWKFDSYIRSMDDSPELTEAEVIEIRSQISCPILLLQGEDSPFYKESNSEYITTLQNCKVVNLPNTGHWLHHEQTDRFLEEVNAFLKS